MFKISSFDDEEAPFECWKEDLEHIDVQEDDIVDIIEEEGEFECIGIIDPHYDDEISADPILDDEDENFGFTIGEDPLSMDEEK